MSRNFLGFLKNYFKGNGEVRKSGRILKCFPGNTEEEYNLLGEEKKNNKKFSLQQNYLHLFTIAG